ncbi:MAG TPA: hypothetical protein VGS96_12120 [Thermoanaerobaculia bacterium]|jgi:hypothetical protein|nr:hypothetical protein [Thermoanaerobaculia bacterium]
MRNVAVVVAILLLIPVARAADVEIRRPHIVFVSEGAASMACKSASRRACTTVKTEFFCACARAGDQWTVRSRFIATPFIHTSAYTFVRHELDHIADIRSSLNEYGDALSLHVFLSEETCISFIKDEAKFFGDRMKLIQRLTTIKRDGVHLAASE